MHPIRRNVRVYAARTLASLILVSVAGCVHVAPYERGVLAQPAMTTNDLASGMEQHVRAVSEGATGGFSGGGGGCGCN